MNNQYKKSNFKTAFMFLNKKQRNALSVIYSFMRMVDDLADLKNDKVNLKKFKNEIEDIYEGKNIETEHLKALKKIINEYKIPSYVFLKLIEGVEKDLSVVDIKTRAELEDYMFCVAGTVGVAVLKIVEYKGRNLEDIAKQTGFAVQMTNILRDLKEDLKINRNYIPREERIKFFKDGEIDFNNYNFRAFFEYEKKFAFKYYENAENFFKKNKSINLFVPSVMKNLYFELLKQLDFELNPKNHKISNYKRIKAVFNSIIEILF